MKRLTILITLILSLNAVFTVEAVANIEQRRSQILKLIEEELTEVRRLNKQNGSRNPRLLLRMAELLLEKARHLKEIENRKYLALSPEERSNKNKKRFFWTSRKYFIQAQKTCLYILRRFRKLRNRGNVYYILAYNAKEFGKHANAEKYFKSAIKYSKKGTEINSKSKLALADIYYNNQLYKRAIPLYEQALAKIDDQWRTKDMYNLAWCYFKLKRYKRAISRLLTVDKLSKNKKYVNMSRYVDRDLAFFYTESGQTSKAVRFYKKRGKNIAKNLLKVSQYLLSQGKYSQAEKTLEQALKHRNSEEDLIAIHIELLALYDRYGKDDRHLRSCKILLDIHKKKKLNKNNFESLKFHVQKKAAILQKQAASKTYSRVKKARDRKADLAVQYFQILSQLNPGREYMASFHAGETNFNAKKFNKAAADYEEAYRGAKAAGNKKVAKISLDGLLASLGNKGIKKATMDKYLVPAYRNFIEDRPTSKENYKIIQRLFSIHMEKKDIPKAEAALYDFKKRYPKDYSTQEAMMAKIMDYHKSRKDEQAILSWVRRINSGEFKVSKKYAEKVRLLLLTMQFDDVQKASRKGDKKSALVGYLKIYKAAESSPEARKNAAYNLATLFHQLGDSERTYSWSERALEQMTPRDIRKFESSFVTMATDLFNKRRFEQASKLNDLLFRKVCAQKSRNKDLFYKNANVIYLANNQFRKAEGLLKKAYSCRVKSKIIHESVEEQIKYLYENKRWNDLERKIEEHYQTSSLHAALIYPMSVLVEAYRESGRTKKANDMEGKMLATFEKASKRKQVIELEALDAVAKVKITKLFRERDALMSMRLKFPESSYNKILQDKFNQLDKVTTLALDVLAARSGEGIVTAYQVLVASYGSLASEIENFTPPGKSSGYVKGFKRSMRQLVSPLRKKEKEFRSSAVREINRSSILSKSNNWFLQKNDYTIEYLYPKGSVLMDRGGRR